MILHEIAEKTKKRIQGQKEILSLETIKKQAYSMPNDLAFSFEKALKQKEISFICEVKKASPSKGIISKEFPYIEIAKTYEQCGAAAISVLTEPFYFLGHDQYLREIAKEVRIPIIRKDFTIDEYMIYEAKVLGAQAILLICALLDEKTMREYMKIAEELGLSVLVEAHDEEEVRQALACNARMIGVNNRNLKTFEVDIENSIKLRSLIPQNVIYVSESGMKTPQDIKRLRENGTDAVLIGETLMRSNSIQHELNVLRGNWIEN